MRANVLAYDIPENCGVVNPSGFLRRRAVRLQFSCWIILDQDVPHVMLDRWTKKGVTWDLIPLAGRGADKILGIVKRCIARDIAEAQASLEASNRRLVAQMEEDGTDDAPGAVAYFARRLAATQANAEKTIADLQEAGQRFALKPETLNIADALVAIESIRQRTIDLGQEYIRGAVAICALDPNDLMGKAALADLVPAEIFGDYVAEKTGDDSLLQFLHEDAVDEQEEDT